MKPFGIDAILDDMDRRRHIESEREFPLVDLEGFVDECFDGGELDVLDVVEYHCGDPIVRDRLLRSLERRDEGWELEYDGD